MKGYRRILFFLKLAEIRLRFIVILVATALLVGHWDSVQNRYERWRRHIGWDGAGSASQPASGPAKTEYFCPMHTFVVREAPDKCPICGMGLIPRKKGEKTQLPEGVVARVQTSPQRIMEAGVKVEPVGYQPLVRVSRAYGEVEPDETRKTRIIARFEGRMDELMVRATGQRISQGEPLARIYSPKFLAAGDEYVQALKSKKRVDSDSNAPEVERQRAAELAQLARQRLKLAGFSDDQLKNLAESGKPQHSITLYAPFSGVILERSALQGDMVVDGTPLFTLADLSHVWVQAKVIESDLGMATEGMPVRVSAVAYPGKEFFGAVDFVYPTVTPGDRTGQVRIVLPNPDMQLRPGMAVTVEMRAPVGRFEQIPALGGAPQSAPASGPVRYTCPMHPEVVSDVPGDCPKCGMKLVPKAAVTSEQVAGAWAEGFTCPMHPGQFGDKEGPCPWCGCGMTLTPYRLEKILALPEEAVIDTGTRRIVYVESAPGVFDAKEVSLGPRTGGFFPLLAGLQSGERIAARGSFLIDAESRLNPQ